MAAMNGAKPAGVYLRVLALAVVVLTVYFVARLGVSGFAQALLGG